MVSLSHIVSLFVVNYISVSAAQRDVSYDVASVDVPAELCFSDAFLENSPLRRSESVGKVPEHAYVIHGGAAMSVWFRYIDLRSTLLENQTLPEDEFQRIVTSATEIEDFDVTVTNGDVRNVPLAPHTIVMDVRAAENFVRKFYKISEETFQQKLRRATPNAFSVGPSLSDKIDASVTERRIRFNLTNLDADVEIIRALGEKILSIDAPRDLMFSFTLGMCDKRDVTRDDVNHWQTLLLREALRETIGDDIDTLMVDFEPHTDMMWDSKYYRTKEKLLARFGVDRYHFEIPFARRPIGSLRRVLSIVHPRVTLGWHIDMLSLHNFEFQTNIPEKLFAEKMKRRLNRVKAFLIASDVFSAKKDPTNEEKMFILGESDPLRIAARVLLRSGFAETIERGDWSYAETIEKVQSMFEGQGLFLDWTL